MKLTKRKDGRWQYNFSPGKGIKPKPFYSSESNEKKAEKEILRKIAEYQEKAQKKGLFANVAESWSDEHFPTLEYNSLKAYKPALADAKEYFAEKYISDIKPNDIKAYIQMYVKKGYAYRTVRNRLLVVSLICKYAAVEGYIDYNPCQYIQVPKSLPKTKRQPASKEDIERVTSNTDKRFGVFALFVLVTGCRRGEALALAPEDINLKTKTVHIDKTVIWIGNKPKIKKRPKSHAGIRDLPLPDFLLVYLMPLMSQKFLFPNDRGELMSNSQVTRWWEKYKEVTGATTTPHPLRHSYSTSLYDAGVDVKTMQCYLGHADAQTTLNIYTHLSEKTKDESTQKLKKHFNDIYSCCQSVVNSLETRMNTEGK